MTATEKAQRLLEEKLSLAEMDCLLRYQGIAVRGSLGGNYFLRVKSTPFALRGVYRIYEFGQEEFRFGERLSFWLRRKSHPTIVTVCYCCVYALSPTRRQPLPEGDDILAIKWVLEGDELSFRHAAVMSPPDAASPILALSMPASLWDAR